MYLLKNITMSLMLISVSSNVSAKDDDVNYCAEDSPSGVMHFPEGRKTISVYRGAVEFSDPRGIEAAFIKSGLRAKGQLIDAMRPRLKKQESLTSSRGFLNKDIRVIDENGETVSDTMSRQDSDALETYFQLESASIIRGVIKFAEAYDDLTKSVCVAYGTSQNSRMEADSLYSAFNEGIEVKHNSDKTDASGMEKQKGFSRTRKFK